MLFNGHTKESIDEIDELTMAEIMVMFADGVIGNRKTIEVLGNLVAGVFNYMRTPNSSPYSLKSTIGEAYGYLFKDEKISASESLLTFMSQAQGFSMDKFKG